MKRNYFSLVKSENEATINIYGDITSWAWEELGEVSAYNLSKQLEELTDVSQINVYINSYGGEVAEGLAIYNALKRHSAKVKTVCDGFSCSIASVIFMAGDERVMNEASLLMIHNAWTCGAGNANELRKLAEDMDKITQASIEVYKANSSLTEEEIKEMMDAETWILPEEALEYGFATSVENGVSKNPSQNAFVKLLEIIRAHQEEQPEAEESEESEGIEEDEEAEGEEETEDEESEESEEETVEETEETATQNWSGFFNAILK